MSGYVNPCFSLAVDHLHQFGSEKFAIWVLEAPYPGGKAHHARSWSGSLTSKWLLWQEMFSLQSIHHLPIAEMGNSLSTEILPEIDPAASGQQTTYGGRLMQDLGISLWQWLFDASIRNSWAQSQGIAIGQNKPLRLRLEIRDPNLISLPWEIMQPEPGKPAISLNQSLLFSRTISNVEPLRVQTARRSLNILLVLGHNPLHTEDLMLSEAGLASVQLQLEKEANILNQLLEQNFQADAQINQLIYPDAVTASVDRLVQPTLEELTYTLETGDYNILFYAGHGVQAPDGGLIFLRPDVRINGTELAQVLVRTQVTLAVFNTCLGAQPDQRGQQSIERSSLAEVLIHHGVPAVLGMRDSIADREAISFIQSLTQALAQRMSIDQAVAVARQQLLTLYKFNQPAWTLPILYMHPEFDGQLIKTPEKFDYDITELPTFSGGLSHYPPIAVMRALNNQEQSWRIRGGLMRVGRSRDNDLVIQERWVSQKHAEIICRENFDSENGEFSYFLRDFSRYGTLILANNEWQKIHHQEVSLHSCARIKFGSLYGQTLEFVIETPSSTH